MNSNRQRAIPTCTTQQHLLPTPSIVLHTANLPPLQPYTAPPITSPFPLPPAHTPSPPRPPPSYIASPQPSPSLTILYHNVDGFRGQMHEALLRLIDTSDVTQPDTPLVYALVEAGVRQLNIPPDWQLHHRPGTAKQGQPSGGISVVAHGSCPIQSTYTSHIAGGDALVQSSAIEMVVIAPHNHTPFRLLVAYIHPHTASTMLGMGHACDALDMAMAHMPHLPLLIVGDFNARHPRWHDTIAAAQRNGGSNELAAWIEEAGLAVHNKPNQWTRVCSRPSADSTATTSERQPRATADDGEDDEATEMVEELGGRRGTTARETRNDHTATIIDLALSSPDTLVSDLTTQHGGELYNNDHVPLVVTLELPTVASTSPPPSSSCRIPWAHTRDEPRWQQDLPQSMARFISLAQPHLDAIAPGRAHIGDDSPQARLEEAYGALETAILQACTASVGVRQPRPAGSKTVEWWTTEVDKAFRWRNRTANNWRRACRPDRPTDPCRRQQMWKAQRQWIQTVQAARRQARERLATAAMDKDSRLRAATLRRFRRSPFTPLTGIADVAGNMPIDHTHSLTNLCSAFVANGTPPPLPTPPDAARLESSTDAERQRLPQSDDHHRSAHRSAATADDSSDSWTFTPAEVAVQTRRRTCKTSAGPDTVLPLFLRYGGQALWAALAAIFNYSWRHSVTPQAWRDANVTALYKGDGQRNDPLCYRPISVTSGIARTFEHLIHDKLAARLADKLADSQFGFRRNRSTSDAILQLLTPIQFLCSRTSMPTERQQKAAGKRAGQHRKLRCAALFLDIQKAFDRVDHDILLTRLHEHGIAGAAWRWIRSFLTGRRMRCVDNQRESAWQHVTYGVPQGCVLSPLLFLVFIDDVVRQIEQDDGCPLIQPTFYADDGVLGPNLLACRRTWERDKRAEEFEEEYNKQLARAALLLDRWCDRSRMRFGQAKTQLVVFSRATGVADDAVQPDNIQLCGFTVQTTDSYIYLGLTLTSDLQWSRHAKRVLSAARAAKSPVMSVAVNARPAIPAIIRELVRSYIMPSFDYGIEYWGDGLPDSLVHALQAAMATPLRTALSLPLHAHQHSTLFMCGVPALAAHVQHKQLLHLRRAAQLCHDTPSHPTARLYRVLLADSFRPHITSMLDVHFAPLPVYGLFALLPAVYPPPPAPHEAHRSQRLPLVAEDAQHGLATLASPTTRGSRIDLANDWLKADGPKAYAPQYQPHVFLHTLANAAFNALHPHNSHQRPTAVAADIRRVRTAASLAEWRTTHMPVSATERGNLSTTRRNRRTTAPITGCWRADTATAAQPFPFMHCRYMDHARPADIATRSRLLLGRAYTATTRRRFPTDAAAAVASTLCSHPSCTANSADESVEHMLLDCPRHASERGRLYAVLAKHELQPTLANILNPSDTDKRSFTRLYTATTAYLTAIKRTRRELGEPDLDGCPYRPTPYPPFGQPQVLDARPALLLSSVASSASLPRDTG